MLFVKSIVWNKENILSPHEESNLRPLDSAFRCSNPDYTDSEVSEVYYEVHMTRVLHTAKISNVDSIMFVNIRGEMVSFELGKEIEKYVFRLTTSVGQRKNSESPWARFLSIIVSNLYLFERYGLIKAVVFEVVF